MNDSPRRSSLGDHRLMTKPPKHKSASSNVQTSQGLDKDLDAISASLEASTFELDQAMALAAGKGPL